MTVNRTALVGVIALLVGLLLGMLIRGGGGDAEALLGDLAGKVDGVGAEVKGLGERLGAMEGSVTEIRSAQESSLAEIGTQLRDVGQQLTDSTESLGGEVQTAVQSQIEEFRSQISALVGRAGGENGGENGGAAAGSGGGTPVTPGSTVMLGDGKVRVFLSSGNAEAGTARVAINGLTTTDLRLGEAVEVEGCRVALTGFDAEGAAMIDGGC